MAVHPSLLLNHRVILIASTFNRNVRASFNLLAKKRQTNPKSSSLNSSFESNSISSHTCIQSCRSISTDSSSTHQLSVDAEINTNGSSPVALQEPLKHELNNSLTFQQAIRQLQDFWASVGCAVVQSSSTEVGAGTMNPATFLRVLGPEPWNVAYVEPSIRPDDSRYGENPNRVQRHTQFQVILKPDPGNAQDLYLKSLSALGIDVNAHDIRFVEDNWESPVLGAWGLGWEVWMDGMEITQFTYFQQAGSLPLSPVSVEITYGLERILMSLQQVNHFKKIWYAPGITYGELFIENEREMSTYNLELADTTRCRKRFDLYDAEAGDMIEKGLAIPAYDSVLKASHVFNILDARGAIGVTERARFFGRMRSLARQCAQLWVQSREKLNYPLGKWDPLSVFHHSPTSLEEAVAESLCPRTFILEIGSEELPPDDVSSGIDQLKSAFQLLLKNRRLQHGKIYASGTPRRLVVVIEDLEPKQDNCEREVRGPPAIKSFNDDGSPTKALEGFCKKNGVTKEDTFIKPEGKVEYVFIRVKEEGRHALEVLAADIPDVIAGISFPKSMRWNSETVYSRPIRWFLALHGDMVLPFEYAGLCSGRFSHGLRASQSSILHVGRAEDYLTVLKNSNIKIDMEERRSDIWAAATSLAMDIGGTIPEDAKGSLLKEVANLVESPVPLLGRFDESFLRLPAEVLTTVMHKHQRYFPVVDAISGKLLPAFIAVANGEIDIAVVRRGNEAVLRARYEDAKFFYESDLSKPLSHFKPQLEGIIFQEKLGSMLDKSVRLESLILKLYEPLGMDEKSFTIAREAASLARADLATSTVMEFTSLAGIMGRHYALCQGRSNEVANAIFESVLPRFAEDVLPETSAGLLLAVADRLDSLVGLFAVGCHPSGSTDQFGLRRTAYGLVKMLVKSSVDLDLKVALQLAADVQPVPVSSNVQNDVLQFIIRRLEQLLVDSGNNTEFVRAVLAERGHIPALGSRSVGQLEEAAKRGSLKKIVEAYARPTRIVRGKELDPSWKVNELLFEVPQEKALWSAYKETASGIYPGIGIDIFIQISEGLVEQLEDYFNNVFVMAENEDLRKNRLAMLQNIAALPAGIVDLSVLPGF